MKYLHLPPLLLRSHRQNVSTSLCQHSISLLTSRTTARGSGRASNATSAPGPSNERKPSDMSISCSLADIRVTVRRSGRLNDGNKKRTSNNLGSNSEPNSKRLKSNNEKAKDEEEPKEPPVVQNGLYATEMMAAHVARQNVISSIMRSKSSKRQRCLIALISRARRHPLRMVF